MKKRRCSFCGVPFPAGKTPNKLIMGKDPNEDELTFCCIGCAKGYEKVSVNAVTPPLKQKLESSPGTVQQSFPVPLDPSLNPYKFLAEKAVEYGASHAVPIMAADVFVDIRAKYKCIIPICRKMGSNLCCPPFSPPVEDTMKLRDSYKSAILIQCEGRPEDFTYEATKAGIQLKYYLRVNNIVSAIESLAQKEGYYLALGFGAGHCKLCGHGIDSSIKCSGVIDGRPDWSRCRYPLRARPAVESVGIDIFKTARKAGLEACFHGITSTLEKVSSASTFGIVFIE